MHVQCASLPFASKVDLSYIMKSLSVLVVLGVMLFGVTSLCSATYGPYYVSSGLL